MSENTSEQPKTRRLANASRRRRVEEDDEDEIETTQIIQNKQTKTHEDATHETGEEVKEKQLKPTRRKAPKAMEVVQEVSLAAYTDPVNMGETSSDIISSSNNNNNNKRNNNNNDLDADGVEDIFEIAFDKYTSKDLYILLEKITRQEVEKKMGERDQVRRQKQAPPVEKFLDATRSSNNNNNNNNNNNDGYSYNIMLQRLFAALNRNKESSAMTGRNEIPVPQLEKIGKKKVIFLNFGRICEAINRPVEDAKDFFEKELSVRGNLDSNNALIMTYQIYNSTAFDNILTKYLDEYVKCNSCRKIDTSLTKEGRHYVLRCNWCTATRSVQPMGTATFSAQVGKRSKARLQALTA